MGARQTATPTYSKPILELWHNIIVGINKAWLCSRYSYTLRYMGYSLCAMMPKTPQIISQTSLVLFFVQGLTGCKLLGKLKYKLLLILANLTTCNYTNTARFVQLDSRGVGKPGKRKVRGRTD